MAEYEEGRYLHNFFIQSKFYFSPSAPNATTDGNLPLDHNMLALVGEHAIEVENLTTLPFDIEVSSAFPDNADGLLFCIDSNSTRATWTAVFRSILHHRTPKLCPVVHVSDLPPLIRVQTTSVRYKRPLCLNWQEEAISPIIELALGGK